MTTKRSGQVKPSNGVPRCLRTVLRPPSQPMSQGVASSPDVVLTLTLSPLCLASTKPVEKRTCACGNAFSFS